MSLYVVLFYPNGEIEVKTAKQYANCEHHDWIKAVNINAKSKIHAAYLAGKEEE